MLDFKGFWEDHLHLASIKMSPFEALYGGKCRSPLCWDDIGDRRMLGPEIIVQTVEKVKVIRKRLKAAQDR